MYKPMVSGRIAALVVWAVIATLLPWSAVWAEEGIPAGSDAVITGPAPMLVRAVPGWDAAVAYELAVGSAVTVWDGAQTAPDGSLWYPIDGGFVPVDTVTSLSSLFGCGTSAQDAAPGAALGEWSEPASADPATADALDMASIPVATAPLDADAAADLAPFEDAVALEQKAGDRNSASGKDIVDVAMRYEGHPYVNGGEGPKAFDCSGFTMFVMHKALGIDISHDMEAQYQMGKPVDRKELQPGDLVFFKNTDHRGLSHTGIYIGDGQFIHAENEATGVTVSELDAEYYRSRWYGAVRLA